MVLTQDWMVIYKESDTKRFVRGCEEGTFGALQASIKKADGAGPQD